MIYLSLKPRDPVIARDGRPFGAAQGRHMKSLNWPYPSVVAGSLRTLLGKITGSGFDRETVARLKSLEVAGPFPVVNNELFFPAPRDIVLRRDPLEAKEDGEPTTFFRRRPFSLDQGEDCNLPEGLLPLGLFPTPEQDFKPFTGPAFWSVASIEQWLKDDGGTGFEPPPYLGESEPASGSDTQALAGFLSFPKKDQRTHVKIEPGNLVSEEGMLFSTTGLVMDENTAMAVRIGGGEIFSEVLNSLSELHPLGGERRLVHWARDGEIASRWNCPVSLRQAFGQTPGVRMILASPGLFRYGWKPGWVGLDLVGTPPGTSVVLRLRAAAVDRWLPISGWGLEKGKVGPKPVRRLVPAGAVYFFNVEQGNPAELIEERWLRSVCDDTQDRNDGFGLTLWGVWNAASKKGD